MTFFEYCIIELFLKIIIKKKKVIYMKKKGRPEYDPTPSTRTVYGDPESCMELLSKYGTYNIQPTAESDNLFPIIAQGLPKDEKDKKL